VDALARDALLAGAGLLAGTVGAAGGITTLVSYPALLAVGIPPLSANVTNAVSLSASLVGSSLGSRVELRGRARSWGRWLPAVLVGCVAGVALLLTTPPSTFAVVVPYLLVLAAAALVAQPVLVRRRAHPPAPLVGAAMFAVGVYVGYFGAGSGVMVLALLLVVLDETIATTNAFKNVLLGAADVVAAAAFLLFGPVRVSAAVALGAGLLVGSYLGPSLTRRAPEGPFRWAAAATGVGLAVWLFVHPA
jgi:uncharacterized protein